MDLLVHRRNVTFDQSNLPHKAGRAWAMLLAATPARANTVFTGKTVYSFGNQSYPRNLTVRAVMNPVPDTRKLA